jgi:outer membrane protein assembly factor BamB
MQIAYGKCYSAEFSGIMYCYNEMTGELLWTYGNGGEGNSTYAGFEVGQGNYPMTIQAIANGVIYTVSTEHTIQTPIYKGAVARAINATDGTEIWTLSDYTGEFFSMSCAVADGYATWFNGYDDRIYSVGRGPSATAVMASPKVSVYGDSVLVEGTVIDVAAGTMQDEQAARFPNGVPAVSDASMKDWMEYVYQQKPRPTDVTGVEVIVSVLDPNNNVYEVGRTTSDENGMFKLMFTPEVPGEYTILATFAGSEGYWGSYAQTAIGVNEAPAATPEPTPTPAPMTDTYILGIGSAILIVVIIGFALLLLRRR